MCSKYFTIFMRSNSEKKCFHFVKWACLTWGWLLHVEPVKWGFCQVFVVCFTQLLPFWWSLDSKSCLLGRKLEIGLWDCSRFYFLRPGISGFYLFLQSLPSTRLSLGVGDIALIKAMPLPLWGLFPNWATMNKDTKKFLIGYCVSVLWRKPSRVRG